jgi:hypothetical protein
MAVNSRLLAQFSKMIAQIGVFTRILAVVVAQLQTHYWKGNNFLNLALAKLALQPQRTMPNINRSSTMQLCRRKLLVSTLNPQISFRMPQQKLSLPVW